MTVLDDPVAVSIIRSVAVSSLCLIPARWLADAVRAVPAGRRTLAIALAISPLFVPDLLVGFSWRIPAARVADQPWAAELLYDILLMCRCLAVGTTACLLCPRSAVTAESLHVWNLLRSQSASPLRWWRTNIALRLQGPWLPGLTAFCLMTLLTFQEFEMAALLQINRHPMTWTVQVFDAQAAWQPIGDTLTMLIVPVAFELLLFIPIVLIVLTSSRTIESVPDGSTAPRGGRPQIGAAWCGLAIALVLLIGVPVATNAGMLLRSEAFTAGALQPLRTSASQITASLVFAVTSAAMVMLLALWILQSSWRLLLLLPGLCGALASSLLLLAAFQQAWLRSVYDTWLPLLTGLVCTHLPRAVLVVLVVRWLSDDTGIHSARMLLSSPDHRIRRRAARLHWAMKGRRWIIAGVVMAHWCFWDVTTFSILRPVDVEPVVTRLYNEMHYGRTEALVLIAAAACSVTPAAGVVLALIGRLVTSIRHRGV